MTEQWKDVVGYEGIYEVSNLGSIRSKEGKTTVRKDGQVRKWTQKILKDKTPNGRDYRVTLWKDGKSKDFLAHRLVALAFLPKIPCKLFVNHKDGNPKNNRVENLEWCDHFENNNHAFDNGIIKTASKIVLVDVGSGEKYEFRSMVKASHFLGRNQGFISNVLSKGKTKVKSTAGNVYKIE